MRRDPREENIGLRKKSSVRVGSVSKVAYSQYCHGDKFWLSLHHHSQCGRIQQRVFDISDTEFLFDSIKLPAFIDQTSTEVRINMDSSVHIGELLSLPGQM